MSGNETARTSSLFRLSFPMRLVVLCVFLLVVDVPEIWLGLSYIAGWYVGAAIVGVAWWVLRAP